MVVNCGGTRLRSLNADDPPSLELPRTQVACDHGGDPAAHARAFLWDTNAEQNLDQTGWRSQQ